ncbi:uncharacterized protein LOC144582778 [Callithrix jacchus]
MLPPPACGSGHCACAQPPGRRSPRCTPSFALPSFSSHLPTPTPLVPPPQPLRTDRQEEVPHLRCCIQLLLLPVPRALEGRGVADDLFLPLFDLPRSPVRLPSLEFPKEKVAGKAETNERGGGRSCIVGGRIQMECNGAFSTAMKG